MSDGSKLWDAIIGFIHGKAPASSMSPPAEKLLSDARKIAAGVVAAAPEGPALLADVTKLAADGAALAASKGLDLPELVEAGLALQQLAADFQKAQAKFQDGMAKYQTAAAIVAAVPLVPLAAHA